MLLLYYLSGKKKKKLQALRVFGTGKERPGKRSKSLNVTLIRILGLNPIR
jgi:hypothetical protein